VAAVARDRAQARVAAFAAGTAAGAWRLDRGAVAARLAELVDEPDLVRQGRLNLCGPAVALVLWLRRDPEAVVEFTTRLYETGRARLGPLTIAPSGALLRLAYAQGHGTCPPAEWMVMAALRDTGNRLLHYAHHDGIREAAAAITLPGAVRTWLRAMDRPVRDETNLLVRKGLRHALELSPAPGQVAAALVAQEMFRRPAARAHRARDRVVSLVPNHWVLLRSPVRRTGAAVSFRFWSWGAEHTATIDEAVFARCYYGALLVG
jgi:hypothetical protein